MGNGVNSKPSPAQTPNGGYLPFTDPVANASRFPTYQAGYAPLGSYQPQGTNIGYANIAPYQQGLTPQQIQKGLGRLDQGMGLAKQSYDKMGQMGGMFMQNAQNAGNAAYNPAIGAYQQALNQNSQNIGAQLASQRGTSVNPGLAARNIGQAGALAAQNAAGQMSSQVAQFKEANQGMAANAYQGQGQMAGIYGNIANAYAQAGLANQGQILNAIAAQNAANVAMQSNVNSSNVAMQSNINNASVAMQSNLNNANVAMTSNINDVMSRQLMNNNQLGLQQYGMGLDYNASLYNAMMGYQSARDSGAGSGGLFGHGGFLGLGLAKGGIVGKHGTPMFAKGGEVPMKKMADGGFTVDPDLDMELASMGGGKGAGGGGDFSNGLSGSGGSPFNLGLDTNLMPGEQAGIPDSGPQQNSSMFSNVGKFLMGSMGGAHPPSGGGGGGKGGDGASQVATMALMALLNKGGMVQKYAQGGMAGAPSVPGPAPQAQQASPVGFSSGEPAQTQGSQGSQSTGTPGAFPGGQGTFPGQGQFPGQGWGVGGTPPGQPRQGTGWDRDGDEGGQRFLGPPVPAPQGFGGQPGQMPGQGGWQPGQFQNHIHWLQNHPHFQNWLSQVAPWFGYSRGGQVQRRAMGGNIQPDTQNPGVVQAQGPGQPNFALAGSPNPQIAMPSTGMPMGNAQTRGGAPMPGIGQSGGYGQPQPQQRPPGFFQGGRVNGSRYPR